MTDAHRVAHGLDCVECGNPVGSPPTGVAGVKHDSGKLPMDLLPFDALVAVATAAGVPLTELPWYAIREVVRVLAFGANKYAPRNWEKGIAHSRTFAACQRHIMSYVLGEHEDPETKLHPLAHAGCEGLFALAFECRRSNPNLNVDDRPPEPSPERDWYWPESGADSALGEAQEDLWNWWLGVDCLASGVWNLLRALDADLAPASAGNEVINAKGEVVGRTRPLGRLE